MGWGAIRSRRRPKQAPRHVRVQAGSADTRHQQSGKRLLATMRSLTVVPARQDLTEPREHLTSAIHVGADSYVALGWRPGKVTGK